MEFREIVKEAAEDSPMYAQIINFLKELWSNEYARNSLIGLGLGSGLGGLLSGGRGALYGGLLGAGGGLGGTYLWKQYLANRSPASSQPPAPSRPPAYDVATGQLFPNRRSEYVTNWEGIPYSLPDVHYLTSQNTDLSPIDQARSAPPRNGPARARRRS